MWPGIFEILWNLWLMHLWTRYPSQMRWLWNKLNTNFCSFFWSEISCRPNKRLTQNWIKFLLDCKNPACGIDWKIAKFLESHKKCRNPHCKCPKISSGVNRISCRRCLFPFKTSFVLTSQLWQFWGDLTKGVFCHKIQGSKICCESDWTGNRKNMTDTHKSY